MGIAAWKVDEDTAKKHFEKAKESKKSQQEEHSGERGVNITREQK